MSLSRLGSSHPVTAAPSSPVTDVARQMEERNVGSVIVVRDGKPIGIVTDRDLVLRVLRRPGDPSKVRVEEVMTRDLVTAPDDLEPIEAATRMSERRIRRLPVVGRRGELLGIVTLDDLVDPAGRTSGQMSEVIASDPSPYSGG